MSTQRTDAMTHKHVAGTVGRARWLIGSVSVCVMAMTAVLWFAREPGAAAVRVTVPEYQDLQSSVSAIGRVIPAHEFQARSASPGLIDHIDVRLGQRVRPGQMLLRLKDPYAATRVAAATSVLETTEVTAENVHEGGSQEDRIGMQNDLERAEQEKTNATASLATLKTLEDNGAASGAEVHAAQLRVQAADQTLGFVKARMSRRFSPHDISSWSTRVAEAKSNLASAKASLDNINITSPIQGTVYQLLVTSNDFVGTGAELLRVADLTQLKVHANFDEADMGKLHDGAAAEIRWEGKPDRVWHGSVEHAPMAAVIVGIRSVGEAVITVTDADNDLPPNTSVTVSVTTDRRRHVLTLPREALHAEAHSSYVYRLEQGKLTQTPVLTGLMNLDRFEVVQGIGPGASVALHTADDAALYNGMKVEARP